MWGVPGNTVRRYQQDQAPVLSLTAGQQFVPFKALQTYGYVRSLNLIIPKTAGTITHGTGTNAVQNGLQFPPLQLIQSFTLQMQGSVMLYQACTGFDLACFAWIARDRLTRNTVFRGFRSVSNFGVVNAAADFAQGAGTSVWPFAFPTLDNSNPGLASQFAPYLQWVSNTSLQFAYRAIIPISEWIHVSGMPIAQSGAATLVADKPIETGLLIMQQAQQNISPVMNLNPVYGSPSASLINVTGNDTAALNNLTFKLSSSFYDVPAEQPGAAPKNQPFAYMVRNMISRVMGDYTVGSQTVTITYRNAGDLLALIFQGFNDTTNRNTLVDLTQLSTTVIQFQVGASVVKFNQLAPDNAWLAWDRYGDPPPGILVFDFMEDGDLLDVINTAGLISIQVTLTGLPVSVTRIRSGEKRLIKVKQ